MEGQLHILYRIMCEASPNRERNVPMMYSLSSHVQFSWIYRVVISSELPTLVLALGEAESKHYPLTFLFEFQRVEPLIPFEPEKLWLLLWVNRWSLGKQNKGWDLLQTRWWEGTYHVTNDLIRTPEEEVSGSKFTPVKRILVLESLGSFTSHLGPFFHSVVEGRSPITFCVFPSPLP